MFYRSCYGFAASNKNRIRVTNNPISSIYINVPQSFLNDSMIYFCLSICTFPTTSSPNPMSYNPGLPNMKFSGLFWTVSSHQGLQRQIMLKQFASLKNCRCTWQFDMCRYTFMRPDTIEINRNINMVFKILEIYWYDLICFAMVNYVSLAACCCTQNMLVGLNLHEKPTSYPMIPCLGKLKRTRSL